MLRKDEYVYIDARRPPNSWRDPKTSRIAGAGAKGVRPEPGGQAGAAPWGLRSPTKSALSASSFETEQFSERVAGVDVWRKPVLPWLTPVGKNQWVPERFGLRVGDDYFVVPVDSLHLSIGRAGRGRRTRRRPTAIDVSGLFEAVDADAPPPPQSLTINNQTLAAVQGLRPFATVPDPNTSKGEAASHPIWDAATQGKLFLVVRDNFEEVEYSTNKHDTAGVELGEPAGRASQLATSGPG